MEPDPNPTRLPAQEALRSAPAAHQARLLAAMEHHPVAIGLALALALALGWSTTRWLGLVLGLGPGLGLGFAALALVLALISTGQ